MGGHCRPLVLPHILFATFVIRSLIPGVPGPKELLSLPGGEEAGLVVSVFPQFLGWGAVYASCITGPSLNKSVMRSGGKSLAYSDSPLLPPPKVPGCISKHAV